MSGFSVIRESAGKLKHILLVSGWQDVNIGDIAHTPGLLHVLDKYMPKAKITLWKKSKSTKEVYEMLQRNFPNVEIIYGDVNADGTVESPDVLKAFKNADVMIHGSGPSVVGQPHLQAWHNHTKKPFGIFGTTIQHVDDKLRALLKAASFIYTRETASLKVLEKEGVSGQDIQFAPDATFYLNIHDEKKAAAFMTSAGLEKGKFICAVPRLRYTPYHEFANVNWTAEHIANVERVNADNKEKDHAKLREAMITWVRKTGNKVLVCPEMTYVVPLMDELLIDGLPDDVKPHVVKRDYWLPDEAASVYSKSFAVLSFECHSPIIAAANGIPFFYLRQPEDTIKGQMYYDLKFDDWVFEIDQTEAAQISERLLKIINDYAAAKNSIRSKMENIDTIYKDRVQRIARIMV